MTDMFQTAEKISTVLEQAKIVSNSLREEKAPSRYWEQKETLNSLQKQVEELFSLHSKQYRVAESDLRGKLRELENHRDVVVNRYCQLKDLIKGKFSDPQIFLSSIQPGQTEKINSSLHGNLPYKLFQIYNDKYKKAPVFMRVLCKDFCDQDYIWGDECHGDTHEIGRSGSFTYSNDPIHLDRVVFPIENYAENYIITCTKSWHTTPFRANAKADDMGSITGWGCYRYEAEITRIK